MSTTDEGRNRFFLQKQFVYLRSVVNYKSGEFVNPALLLILRRQVYMMLKTPEKFDVTNQHICEMNRGMKNYTNISNPYWKISTTSAL